MKNRASAKEEKEKCNYKLSHGEFSLRHYSLWLFIMLTGIILFISAFCQLRDNLSLSQRRPGRLKEQEYLLFANSKVKRICQKNGMIVLVKEDHRQPLVSLFLSVRCGSAAEGKFKGTGIAHFVEHMVFKGTKERGLGDIFREIESYGGTINAFTSYDYTGYKVTVPSEFAFSALRVLQDMVINAAFEQKELEKEREVILQEIKLNYDHPQRHASLLLWQSAYLTHPYKYPILGKEDLFQRLTREDLLEFYQTGYTPGNMVLAIVGDVDKELALSSTRDIFRDFKRKGVFQLSAQAEPKQNKLRKSEEKFTAGLAYLLLGFHGVAIADDDCYALDVLAAVLGEGESSRLYNLICHKKELAYSIEALNYTPRDPGLFIISSSLEERRQKPVLSLILQQIERIKKNRVSERELASAKNKIISNILFAHQTIEAQAEDLALNEAITANFRFTDDYLQKVNQVTARDILRVANKYLNQNNLNIVALLPREQADTYSVESLSANLNVGIENLTRSPKQKEDIKKFVLSNGVTLLVKENKDLPLVAISAVFKGGLLAEDKNSNGLCNLAAQMLDKGSKTKNASFIANFVESRGARLFGFSGNNSFGLSLDLLSKDFDQMLELFGELIIYSTFPRNEFNRQKMKNLAQLKAEEDDIFASGMKLLRATLFQRHPYRFSPLGDEKSIKRLTQRQLKDFYHQFCVGKNMVLAIFGDVNSQQTLIKVKRLFAELDTGKPLPLIAEKELDTRRVRQAAKSLPKKQSLVLVGFRGSTVFSPERYRLEIICEILSGASGRLFSQIREKQAEAYTLGAYSVLGLDPGYLVIYVATTAENVEAVKNEILQQLNWLKQKPLSETELAQVKRSLISRKLISRQTNSSCALESALDELYGLGCYYYLKYAQEINRIKASDIQRCAQQYFDLHNYALVVLGPQMGD